MGLEPVVIEFKNLGRELHVLYNNLNRLPTIYPGVKRKNFKDIVQFQ